MYKKTRILLFAAGSFFITSAFYSFYVCSFAEKYLLSGISVTVFTEHKDSFRDFIGDEEGYVLRKYISPEEGLEGLYEGTGLDTSFIISIPSAFNLGFNTADSNLIEELIRKLKDAPMVDELVYSDSLIEKTISFISRLRIIFNLFSLILFLSGLLFLYAGAHIYSKSRRSELMLSRFLGYGGYMPYISIFRRAFVTGLLFGGGFSLLSGMAIYYAGADFNFMSASLPPAFISAFTAGVLSVVNIGGGES